MLVTSGPGATNAVTGLVDALMDFDPHRLPHRPGPDPPDRQRRVPGSRHHRHHASRHQAQLPGQARRRPRPGGARSVLRCAVGPSRAGGDRPAEGHCHRQGALHGGQLRPSSYRPQTEPEHSQIAKAIALLKQAKRPMVYTGGGVINAGPAASSRADAVHPHDRLPDHQHADGAGRVSGKGSAVPRHAGHARHLRIQSRDARLRRSARRWRPLRRPRHRTAQRVQPGVEEDPRRHRRLFDQQECAGRRTDHRRRRPCAGGAGRRLEVRHRRARHAGAGDVVAADRWMAGEGQPEVHPGPDPGGDHQAAIRDPAAV